MATRAIKIDDDDFVTPEPVGNVDDGVETPKPEGDEGETADDTEGEGRKLSDAEKLKRARTREKRYRQEAQDAKRTAETAAAETAELKARVAQIENATVGQAKLDLANRVTWLQQQRRAALDAGNTAQFDEFDTEMRKAEKQLAKIEDAEANGRTTPREQQQQRTQNAGITPAAQGWIDENPWFKDPARSEDAQIARAVSTAVRSEGFDPGDDEFWEEVDRRLGRRGIAEKQATQTTRTGGRAGSPPLAGASRGSGTGGSALSKIPKESQEAYRRQGIDIDDPKVAQGIVERHGHRWEKRRAG